MKEGSDTIYDKVKLSEYLAGKCIYGGCKYNDNGTCFNEDADFLNDVEYLVNINGVTSDTYIGCSPNIRDGHCPYCGIELVPYNDIVEYWGAKVPMSTWYCPNMCQ